MVIGYRHVGHKVKLDTGGQISYKLLNAKDDDEEVPAEDALLKQLEAGLTVEDGGLKEGAKEQDQVQGVFGKVRVYHRVAMAVTSSAQAGAKLGTLWSGEAIADHMEDRYLANMKVQGVYLIRSCSQPTQTQGVYEKLFGKVTK